MISWKQKSVLLLTGILLSALLGEAALRVLGYSGAIYSLNHETGLITLKPDSKFNWIKECYKNQVTTNNDGFHDRQHSIEKPQGIFRIAVLGDSQVESLQVPLEKMAYTLLEKKLNEKLNGEKVEILSFGHAGNGQLLDKLYLDKYVLKYHPNLVIDLFLVANDPRDDNRPLADIYVRQTGDSSVYSKPYASLNSDGTIDYTSALNLASMSIQKSTLKQVEDNTIKKSALAAWLYNDYRNLKTNFAQKKSTQTGDQKSSLDSMPVDLQVVLKDYPVEWEQAWKVEEKLLKDISMDVKNSGAKFLLISSADEFRVDSANLSWQKDYPDKLDFDEPERILGSFSSQNDLNYLPLQADIKAKSLSEGLNISFPCDGHWNATTHSWVAQIMTDYLLAHKDLLGQ